MEPEEWFAKFDDALAAVTGGSPGDASDAERQALLDLARLAAHSSERWTAPITTYLAGLAMAEFGAAERGSLLLVLVDALE